MRLVSDDVLAALNIWMEARGEPFEGKVAVAEVMRNRLSRGRWGKTLVDVVLSPYQFSGWNTKDPNRISAMLLDEEDEQCQSCLKAWEWAKHGSNLTNGATHYYNPKLVKERPEWADPEKRLVVLGNHEFYKE